MKGENYSFKKNLKISQKMNFFFRRYWDLQMQHDGVNLLQLSKKITHLGARLGLAGRSIAKQQGQVNDELIIG
jgi:hypothetical protein